MRILTPAMITLIMLFVIGALILAYIGKTIFFQEAPPPPEIATRLVPMAASDIPAGTMITSSHVVMGRLRTDKLVRESILNKDTIIGRYALKEIKQAQPFLTSDLYAPNTRPPLALAPGMQAITIGLGDGTAVVDGLIKPGDYVDVHLTVDNNPSDKRYRGGFTMTLFQGVRVLAMNRMTQPTTLGRGSNTLTLELTPQQANIVLQAKEHGQLTVSYNPNGPGTGGVTVADDERAYLEEILGLPLIPIPPDPFLTEIYRGTYRSLINYDDFEEDDYGGATPWVEEPGWAPPRNGGNFRRGGQGSNNSRGFRGTQSEGGNNAGGGGSAAVPDDGMSPVQTRYSPDTRNNGGQQPSPRSASQAGRPDRV